MGAAFGWGRPLLFGLRSWLSAAATTCCGAVAAGAPEPLHWMLTEGDDQVQQIVARHLPGVQNDITRANSKRVWKSLLDGQPACTADLLFRGEHAGKIYFSPTVLSMPSVILVRPGSLAVLPRTAQGSVQLPRLLDRADLLGAAVAGRYYGQAVNAQLAQRPRGGTLTLLDSGYAVTRVIEMLLSRRVDYAIAYASDVDEPSIAAQVQAGVRPVALPIDGADKLVQAGTACPRTPWGRAAMRRIDGALSAADSVAELEKIQELFMTEADRKRYAPELAAFFRARARPMMVPEEGGSR